VTDAALAIPESVDGVLFDADGTLVDSTYFHTVSWWQSFAQQSVTVPMAILHRAIGMGADKLIQHVLDEAGIDAEVDAEQATAAHDAFYSGYWAQLQPLPGARAVLERCHRAGIATVLASSASERELAVLRRVLDSDDWIDVATCSADAGATKPAPDLVEVALQKAGLAADRALFVGDAVWDIEAAKKLDVAGLGLESGGTGAAELRRAGAVATYRDPQQLLRRSEEWLKT